MTSVNRSKLRIPWCNSWVTECPWPVISRYVTAHQDYTDSQHSLSVRSSTRPRSYCSPRVIRSLYGSFYQNGNAKHSSLQMTNRSSITNRRQCRGTTPVTVSCVSQFRHCTPTAAAFLPSAEPPLPAPRSCYCSCAASVRWSRVRNVIRWSVRRRQLH